jgi:uncharacterized protein YjbJ (UPF0337 family)
MSGAGATEPLPALVRKGAEGPTRPPQFEVSDMHKDTIKGAAKDAKGQIKEAAGKATGDDRLAAEGAADRVAGKMQKGVGEMKDAARKALKH